MADRLRWGVLGAADIARNQVIPAIQGSSNGVVMALASRDVEKGRAMARELGIARVYGRYQDVLDDPEIDAIYNPLPNTLHAEWTIKAAEAGKAILCEKPLAVSAGEAERVAEVCARRGVPLMEAFMYRFHPQNVRMRELLAQGAIGEVREVRASLCVRLMEPPDPANVRLQRQLGGGTLLDMGCYTVNATRMAFGAEPLRVKAWQDIDERFGVDVTTAALLEFSDRRLGLMSCSFRTGDEGWYMVAGSHGTIEAPNAIIPGYGPRLAETTLIIADPNRRRHEERFPPANQYRLMAESFADTVLTGAPVPLPPQDAILNMRVLDAIVRSAARNDAESVA